MMDVTVLTQALPYIQRYKGSTFVIKVGGEMARDPALMDSLAGDVSLLMNLGIRVCLVHGGGPQATELAKRLGHPVTVIAGRRVTDDETLEVAKMVFAGKINVEFLSALRKQSVRAVGVSGVDGGILQARRRPQKIVAHPETGEPVTVDFGLVGDVVGVDTALLKILMENSYVPVVASLAADEVGVVYNINADTVAEELAKGLQARKLISLTDVPGVLRDPKDPASLVSHLSVDQARELVKQGVIGEGMLPKIAACLGAVEAGVRRAHIISGRQPHAILAEVFTQRGVGTMIATREREQEYLRELGE